MYRQGSLNSIFQWESNLVRSTYSRSATTKIISLQRSWPANHNLTTYPWDTRPPPSAEQTERGTGERHGACCRAYLSKRSVEAPSNKLFTDQQREKHPLTRRLYTQHTVHEKRERKAYGLALLHITLASGPARPIAILQSPARTDSQSENAAANASPASQPITLQPAAQTAVATNQSAAESSRPISCHLQAGSQWACRTIDSRQPISREHRHSNQSACSRVDSRQPIACTQGGERPSKANEASRGSQGPFYRFSSWPIFSTAIFHRWLPLPRACTC